MRGEKLSELYMKSRLDAIEARKRRRMGENISKTKESMDELIKKMNGFIKAISESASTYVNATKTYREAYKDSKESMDKARKETSRNDAARKAELENMKSTRGRLSRAAGDSGGSSSRSNDGPSL